LKSLINNLIGNYKDLKEVPKIFGMKNIIMSSMYLKATR